MLKSIRRLAFFSACLHQTVLGPTNREDRAALSVAPMVPPAALTRFRALAESRPEGIQRASLVAAGDANDAAIG